MRSILIKILIVLIFVSGPVTVGFIGWGMMLVAHQVPLWVFMILGVCMVITWVGIAAALDEFGKRQRQQGDR